MPHHGELPPVYDLQHVPEHSSMLLLMSYMKRLQQHMPCSTNHTLCSDTSNVLHCPCSHLLQVQQPPWAAAACGTIRHLFYLVHLLYTIHVVYMFYLYRWVVECVYLSCKHAMKVHDTPGAGLYRVNVHCCLCTAGGGGSNSLG
jgi:hypothetical protein